MKRIFLALIIIVLMTAGCSSTKPVAQEPIIILSDDININLLDRKIENLRDTMTLAFASMDEYYIARTTKLRAQLDLLQAENSQMSRQTDSLIARINHMNYYVQELNKMPIFFGSPKVIAEQTVKSVEELIGVVPEEDIIIKPEVVIPEVKTPLIVTDAYMDKYKEGLNRFYFQRYNDAIEIFESLLSENPRHQLAGNIQYWIGESYYALRQYRNAYNAFNSIFNTNAFDKYDDAQLKIAFCYFKMGRTKAAIQEFQNLITYYPNSEHVSIAIRQIGIIKQYTTPK